MDIKIGLVLLLTSLVYSLNAETDVSRFRFNYSGRYCSTRPHPQCCKGRDDTCSVDISTTKCYCDAFCVRRPNKDCCPDYEEYCEGQPSPLILGCTYNNQHYKVGDTLAISSCTICTCTQTETYRAEMECTNRCPPPPPPPPIGLADMINQANLGWRATNYQFISGNTIENLYRTRVGVCKPATTLSATLLPNPYDPATIYSVPQEFDARVEWPGWVQPIHDQNDKPTSWAISTADVISDRMSIRTKGHDIKSLSAQNLIGCVSQRPYCKSTSDAWVYANKYGITTAQCYPYMGYGACDVSMGEGVYTTRCQDNANDGYFYRMPHYYKVGHDENHIKYEILMNGPVQAHIKVDEDFFYYQSGVYKRSPYGTHQTITGNFLAVRIIGWGVDHSYNNNGIKYWLCANSWGSHWGENGYFKVLRGHNENEIESHVYSIWPVSRRQPSPLYEP